MKRLTEDEKLRRRWTPVKMLVVFELHTVLSHVRGPGLWGMMEDGTKHAARLLGERMLRDGLIRFEVDEVVRTQGINSQQTVRATAGVFDPAATKAFDDAVEVRSDLLAKEVIKEAKALLRNWGAEQGLRKIGKGEAARLVGEALPAVLKRRRQKWKAA